MVKVRQNELVVFLSFIACWGCKKAVGEWGGVCMGADVVVMCSV